MVVKLLVLTILLTLANKSVARSHSKHTIVNLSEELNDATNHSTSPVQNNFETDSPSYLNSSVNAVNRVINALPTPTQILNYGKQTLIGIPAEIAYNTKRFLCSKIVRLNDIEKEYHPTLNDVNYVFITQDQENVTISLNDSEYLFNHPKFHMNWNLVLFVTGWNLNITQTNETIFELYNAYRCRRGYNFVVLDTSKFVNSMYAWSEFSTEPIGEMIGDAIANLTRFVSYDRIHLIGNGIGSHIAGMVGRHFTKLTGNVLPRITGLEPSRPCFSESDRSNGLQRGDGLFVDIIHSFTSLWGLDPIGDADFYPGPNIIQRGCWSLSCSKVRAVKFYAWTVYPGNEYLFNATRCENFNLFRMGNCNSGESRIPLGILTPNWARGKLFLTSPDLQVQHSKRCNDL